MGKRLISVLLTAVLLVGLLPAHAGAAEETSGTIDGTDLKWSLEDNGTLTISGNGAMPNFPFDYGMQTGTTPWWGKKDNITAVVIHNGVTTIGNYAFYECGNLKEVTIPFGVETIGWYAFAYCSNLTSVTIPSGVTTIGDYAFRSCSSLKEVTIPSGVTTIGDSAFEYCRNLTSVTIPSSVTSIEAYAFADCESLATVTFLGKEPPSTMGYQIFYDSNITTVNVPAGSEALYLEKLTNSGIPNWVLESYLKTYQLTVNWNGGSGTISPQKAMYLVWDEVTLTPTAPEGKVFDRWTVEPAGYEANMQGNTFTMPRADVTIIANWKDAPPEPEPEPEPTPPPAPQPTPPSGGGSGSPPSPSYYPPRVNQTAGGSVEISPARPQRGDTVTITATPDAGKMVSFVGATDRNGNTVEVTENGGIWTFTQPISVVTVGVVFVDEVQPWRNPFGDVQPDDWCYDAVQYVTENGLMTGTGISAFSPNATSTRAMLWAILARQDGTEISGRAWEAQAQAWATAEGISDGTNPAGMLTREQLVTMLYRAAGSPTVSGTLSAFADAADVSAYAQAPLAWAVENGIVGGVGGNRVDPLGSATRAQLAAMLMRYIA